AIFGIWLACDGVRPTSRCDPPVPALSARQEILTSLVSALDSVCMAMSKLNAEVACITVHEDSVIALGTEKGRIFLNSKREIQTEFYKHCREHGKIGRTPALPLPPPPPPPDTQSNIFVLRKMVDEVFTVLYSEAAGKSTLVPVPYEWLQKEPACLVARGLPEGVSLRKPSEYDSKTLIKILEQSHRIHFTVTRSAPNPGQTLAHIFEGCPKYCKLFKSTLMSYFWGRVKTVNVKVFRDKPHFPHNSQKLEMFHFWETTKVPGEQGQTPASVHISKRLLFSIVHEKSEKWDLFIRETEDINTLRECVQILFNSRYAEALGLDHMVPVPYRKIACDPGAVEILGIPDQIPFKRPCTYGVPKLKRILDERHAIRFVVRRYVPPFFLPLPRMLTKRERAEAELRLESRPDFLIRSRTKWLMTTLPPTGPSADCLPVKRIKTEPPDGDIIQVTVPAAQTSGEFIQHEVRYVRAGPPSSYVLFGLICFSTWRFPTFCCSAEALGLPEPAKVPYSKFQMYPEDLFVTGLPEGIALRRPNCFGAAKLRKILAAASHIRFVIKTPRSPPSLQGLESKLSRIDLANTLREQVQDLFNRKYGEALGIKYPVQVPYKRIKNNPDSVIIEGLPPGIPFRKPCTFGSQNLERILAVADKINFTITRPFQGLIPKPDDDDDDDVNRVGEKVVLREQVKELFNKKYGEALGLDRAVAVPYKLIRGSPECVQVDGLPKDVPFRNPGAYDAACLERILHAKDKISFSVKTPEASTSRRKRKRVQETHRGPAPSSTELAPPASQIPQWPMYMVDYSGVNMQVPGKVNY
uniref:GTF2I repeat domain containing 1 n=1 Tax=Hippocampus comes TaxID=109280 RepID=A0A3Q2XSK4_HIPCM